ncbi:hypothetical protein [Anthocerotibacter panamensis]|uniref:hypothetical protein n=1 Tax=Anthocerotibacter panamensis TaxID=2857077 RepID=UPI001C404B62|nr:hypothetical protein [Anthocerotibacter panamensis]
MNKQKGSEQPKDHRMGATITIWTCTTLMMVVLVTSLSEGLQSVGPEILSSSVALVFAFMPAVCLVGAALATGAVWYFGGRTATPTEATTALEERVMNLETIITYEGNDLQTKIQKLRTPRN